MKRGFTLIELLIVVAIIAILAAIAVPNFLEAQVRSKVSRTKAELRTLATAVEAYSVDNNKPPVDGYVNGDGQAFWYVPTGPRGASLLGGITTPIAYLSTYSFVDPFRTQANGATAKAADAPDSNNFTDEDYRRYRYLNPNYTYIVALSNQAVGDAMEVAYGKWMLSGAGPDKTYNSDSGVSIPGVTQTVTLNPVYDATNGTVSRGDVVRSQKYADQSGPHGPGF